MAPVVLELILYILIPQRKLGFKVFSVPNPKPPGQPTISGPSICLGSSDWARLDGNMVVSNSHRTRWINPEERSAGLAIL